MLTRKSGLLAALAALAVAAAGYGGFVAYQTERQEHDVIAALAGTTDELRQALSASPSAEAASRIEGHLDAVRRAHRQRVLADAAEHYIVGARALVQRRAEIVGLEQQAAASRQALAAHMARAASRNSAWFRDAMVLKKKVEREHFDLNLKLKAVDELLEGLPGSYKELAPHVDAGLLVEESLLEEARRRSRADFAQAATELERARSLPGR